MTAGTATSAGWKNGDGYIDSYLRMLSSRSATAQLARCDVVSALCWASKPQEDSGRGDWVASIQTDKNSLDRYSLLLLLLLMTDGVRTN